MSHEGNGQVHIAMWACNQNGQRVTIREKVDKPDIHAILHDAPKGAYACTFQVMRGNEYALFGPWVPQMAPKETGTIYLDGTLLTIDDLKQRAERGGADERAAFEFFDDRYEEGGYRIGPNAYIAILVDGIDQPLPFIKNDQLMQDGGFAPDRKPQPEKTPVTT